MVSLPFSFNVGVFCANCYPYCVNGRPLGHDYILFSNENGIW